MNLVFSTKPYGWPSHQVDEGKIGFVEFLQEKLQQKLWISHRLDKTTSGAMVFAKDVETAQGLQEAFSKQQVKKIYYFITDKEIAQKVLTAESFIEKKDKVFVSTNTQEPNAFTTFEWQSSFENFHLWKAEPKSGKPHQIRLHAKDSEIPILGDSLYGGSDYPFLLLQSFSLRLPNAENFVSPLPPYFKNLQLVSESLYCRAIRAIEDRHILFSPNIPDCLRWIHKEIPWLCVDQLGDHLWIQCFDEDSFDEDLIKKIITYLEDRLKKTFSYHLQIMPNRGSDPNKKVVSSYGPRNWTAEEHGITYEFRADSGSSYGLFLDQRQNRRYVLQNVKNKKVLNLFCYTGGFSLCALKAGASEVISVDTSKNTLSWLETNIALNAFDSSRHKSWSTDARIFLKGAKQREQHYDMIICDPPSFSRSKEGTFKIEKDFNDLICACLKVLTKNGELLFSTNYEGWTQKDFRQQVENALPKGFEVTRFVSSDWDYESPNEERILKAVWIRHASS